MPIALLGVIYLIFISLGLPDGLLGSAWPAIQADIDAPLEFGGLIATVVSLMNIVSSLLTTRLIKRLGLGRLLLYSILLTVVGLIGFSQAESIEWLFMLAIPLGLGAGAIDVAVNNYVANNYGSHHMNWLHAFWGIGAALGPIIFSTSLAASGNWQDGYMTIGIVQLTIALVVALSLPLWINSRPTKTKRVKSVSYRKLLRKKSVRTSSITFLLYSGAEASVGLWLASYLVGAKQISIETAALLAGVYFASITAGRILTGFISLRMSAAVLIQAGVLTALAGVVLLYLGSDLSTLSTGVILIGAGFAPIYPSLSHATPRRFSKKRSDKILGLQMASGFTGSLILPPTLGLAISLTSPYTLPIAVATILICLLSTSQYIKNPD